MKRTIVFLMVLLLAITLVFANGAKETTLASGPVEIELWSSLTGSKAKTFDKQVEAFNNSQDEV